MSVQNPLGEEGDRPIIIQGGGSVNVNVPPDFNEQADAAYQEAASGGKNFKNDKVNLVSLQIDDNPPIPLSRDSKITINCK